MDTDRDRPHPSSAARRTDAALTVVGFVVLLPVAALALLFSGFFAMASDSCFEGCDASPVAVGIGVARSSIGVAVVGAFVGVVLAGRRGAVRAVWPWLGVVLVVLGYLVGASIADSVSG